MSAALRFTKAQAVGNDFLLAEKADIERLGVGEDGLADLAIRACDRHFGVGADGLEVVYAVDGDEADVRIRIFNSDGSEAEISGNGTRCVAAYLVAERDFSSPLRIATAAGVKTLTLLERSGPRFLFEMAMGSPSWREEEVGCELELAGGARTVTILDVGNPQCALLVDDFDFDWRAAGAEIERHPRFPNRTNVSFIRILDERTIDVRFWERGAGETMSSGTGSTGAAVAAVLSGRVQSPLTVRTPAGEMKLAWPDGGDVLLEGPAEVICRGEYMLGPA